MFLLIVTVFFLVLLGLSKLRLFNLEKKKKSVPRTNHNEESKYENKIEFWENSFLVYLVISIVFLVLALGTAMTSFTLQKVDIQEVRKINKVERIYKDKADVLSQQFAVYLSQTYPNLEKDIFKSISPEKVGLYAVRYPEIKSSATLMALVTEISKLQADYYQQKINKEEALRKIRFRLENPWAFYWWNPKPPADILK